MGNGKWSGLVCHLLGDCGLLLISPPGYIQYATPELTRPGIYERNIIQSFIYHGFLDLDESDTKRLSLSFLLELNILNLFWANVSSQ
jgi:hypothetical protein